MPNFRAVSPGATPAPPTFKQSLKIATQNSFDYSSFIFVGITSALAEATDAHPQLGKGMGGFGQYYWRGFVDKTDGNYWVICLLPTAFHHDGRYYALGEGGFWKRGTYAATRIFVARKYNGDNTFNISEVAGRAIAQGISTTYYPSASNTGEKLAEKYAYALGRDALTNVFVSSGPTSRRTCSIATHSPRVPGARCGSSHGTRWLIRVLRIAPRRIRGLSSTGVAARVVLFEVGWADAGVTVQCLLPVRG